MISEKLATTISRAASAALLRIGKNYQERGLLHHALTPYLKILACYPASEEVSEAVDRLVMIAEILEDNGQFRMALSIYDRMERAVRLRRWNGHEATLEGYILDKRLRGLVPERRSVPFPPPSGNGGELEKA